MKASTRKKIVRFSSFFNLNENAPEFSIWWKNWGWNFMLLFFKGMKLIRKLHHRSYFSFLQNTWQKYAETYQIIHERLTFTFTLHFLSLRFFNFPPSFLGFNMCSCYVGALHLGSIKINHSGMLKILFCILSFRSFFANLHVDLRNQRGK